MFCIKSYVFFSVIGRAGIKKIRVTEDKKSIVEL